MAKVCILEIRNCGEMQFFPTDSDIVHFYIVVWWFFLPRLRR